MDDRPTVAMGFEPATPGRCRPFVTGSEVSRTFAISQTWSFRLAMTWKILEKPPPSRTLSIT